MPMIEVVPHYRKWCVIDFDVIPLKTSNGMTYDSTDDFTRF